MRPAGDAARLAAALLLASAAGCGEDGRPSLSPTARPDVVAALRADLAAKRHPADGGGKAWLEDADPDPVPAGGRGRWVVVYEAGPLGIADGGMLFLQVSPFWGWSTPQVEDEEAAGFTRVSTEAPGVRLAAETVDQQLLGIGVSGRPLAAGERVRIEYGAGALGARADLYAERASRLWVAVDGDGDGVRALLPESPAVSVAAGPAVRLALTLPSTARPGDTVRLTVAALDAAGNAALPYEGEVRLEGAEEVLDLPPAVAVSAGDSGRRSLELRVAGSGLGRVRGTDADGLRGVSNALLVSEGPRVLWGDLHGHSGLSDGTGTVEDYFLYARDVAALDVVALTDHDHWGLEPLALHPRLWEEIRHHTRRFHAPHRFVTILGYEWTSWLHGHRHVLYFEDEGEVLSSVDPAYESPLQLWDALRERPALTFAHHSAGGPVATNWDIPPDPELEPVTEIVSIHGSSEAPDSPLPIYSAVPGNFVRDVLDRGYRLGLIGSGDSHDGHPGLAHVASASGGLAAILSEELTREGVLEALRARRVYATNGPRLLLRATLGGHPMGAELPAGDHDLEVLAVGTAPWQSLEIVRSGWIVESVAGEEGDGAWRLTRRLRGLQAGEYLYVRVVQGDGGAVWSSPFFIGGWTGGPSVPAPGPPPGSY